MNILLSLLGCLIALVLLEGLLRIYNPIDLRVRGDKIVLPINRNYRYKNDTIPGLDKVIVHRKNSLGFRGEEPPIDFMKYLTIITIGGSTTECSQISDGKTWPDILCNKLKKQFNYLWLNNAGLDGHSTFGHIVLMGDYIVKIKPKVVLFLIGMNDVGYDCETDYDVEYLGKISFNSLKGFYKSLSAHSELLSLGLNYYRYLKANLRGLSADDMIDLAATEQLNLTDSYCEEIMRLYKLKYIPQFKARVKELVNISKQNGIVPVLITQPLLWGDIIDSVTNINLAKVKVDMDMSGKLKWEILELYNDVIREVAIQENILVIDLAKRMPKNSIFFYDGIHVTNKGAEKEAEIIYADLSTYLAARFGK